MLPLILLGVLFVGFVASLPLGHHRYGWGPSGIVGALITLLVMMMLCGSDDPVTLLNSVVFMSDYRSDQAKVYRHLYWTPRWRRMAAIQRERHPLCERCLRGGLTIPATVSHHRVAHRGDLVLFWDGELESVCKPCHDGEVQREDHGRFVQTLDQDGWPTR